MLKIASCCPCLVVPLSPLVVKRVELVAQSYFFILSYSRKSDLVVSEVQMIVVSHSL